MIQPLQLDRDGEATEETHPFGKTSALPNDEPSIAGASRGEAALGKESGHPWDGLEIR